MSRAFSYLQFILRGILTKKEYRDNSIRLPEIHDNQIYNIDYFSFPSANIENVYLQLPDVEKLDLQFSDIKDLSLQFPDVENMDWQSVKVDNLDSHLIEVAENKITQDYPTEIDISFSCRIADSETAIFIQRNNLSNAIKWLKIVVPHYFPDTNCEIAIIPSGDEDTEVLALRVYGSMQVSQFREQRHLLLTAIKDAGHKKLYDIISIFQRRIEKNEWQRVSCDSYALAA